VRRSRIPQLALAALLALGLLGSGATAQASGGSVMGWGDNFYGQIGNGTIGGPPCSCLPNPTPVTGLSTATQVAGGGVQTLALLANGTVVSWGGNLYGQLGNGTPTLKGTGPRPRAVSGTGNQTPLPVLGLSNVVAVAAGSDHSLALLADGTVMAWGLNEYGTLGIGNVTGPETCEGRPCGRTPVPVPGLSGVIAISASGQLSLALLANGTVMAWGGDYNGQTGDGVGAPEPCWCVDHPVAVPGVTGAVAVAAGNDVGAAMLADGTVRTWGSNVRGQLGDGATIPGTGSECDCRGPGPVGSLPAVKWIAMGPSAGFAVRQSGAGMAWGMNEAGELGNGGTTGGECHCVPAPAAVSAAADLQSIEAGNTHALGLSSAGTVTSWGNDEAGQRGDGTTDTGSGTPTPVPGVSGASAIAAGAATSFAIVGPSQALDVTLAGAGSGGVGTAGLTCPGACGGRYPQSQVVTLRAEPAPGSGFAGFSGACSGSGTCRVTMDGNQSVTATFGPPKGTAITKSEIDNKKKKATFTFSAPGAITGYECKLVKPKAKKKKKAKGKAKRVTLKKKGGKKPKPIQFSPCTVPAAYKNLKPGRYTFEVRALDILGADAVPAVEKFKLKKPKKKRHKSGTRR
jgi:alpha-tubulin suppressor-like RCC1 family protein